MPRNRSSRYGRYAGGPDPLAPPVDLSEALALSDRIGVLFNGVLAGMVDRDDGEGIERIPQLMAGVQQNPASQFEPSEGDYDSAVS